MRERKIMTEDEQRRLEYLERKAALIDDNIRRLADGVFSLHQKLDKEISRCWFCIGVVALAWGVYTVTKLI